MTGIRQQDFRGGLSTAEGPPQSKETAPVGRQRVFRTPPDGRAFSLRPRETKTTDLSLDGPLLRNTSSLQQ